MKKIWIIIGVVAVIILILGGVWWYLLLNGRPEGMPSIPNPFGSFGGQSEFSPQQEEQPVTTETSPRNLRRISESPVAGALFTEENGTPVIKYVERGTGHIFEFDVSTSALTRTTNTTVPRTTDAFWSPQGTRVVIISEATNGQKRIFVSTVGRTDEGEEAVSGTEITSDAYNVAFSETGDTLYYTIPSTLGSTGYAHDLKTDEREVLFSSPLRDIVVVWEPRLIVYTAPSGQTPGYAYMGSSLSRIAGNRYGLMITPTDTTYALTYLEEGSLVSYTAGPTSTPLAISVIPDKCTPGEGARLWCGAPTVYLNGNYPDLWYQGTVSLDDALWETDIETGISSLHSLPSQDVGEALDIIGISLAPDESALTFINKRDGILWLYEIPEEFRGNATTTSPVEEDGI